jgi:hypothetical protein
MDYPLWTELTLIFSVMSDAFYKREFSSKTAYRKSGSHITLSLPPITVAEDDEINARC